MAINGFRLQGPYLSGILEIAHQFLLFGVDADHRLSSPLVGRPLRPNVVELSIPLRLWLAAQPLDVGMQPIVVRLEDAANHGLMHSMALLG